MDDISVHLPPTPYRTPVNVTLTSQADPDSDVEVIDIPSSSTTSSPSNSPTKQTAASRTLAQNELSAKAKGKRRARTEDIDDDVDEPVATGEMPSDAVFATWRKGDDDMEPSTKMLGLIDLLNKWDDTGDKTICYSQCKLHWHSSREPQLT